MAIEVGNCHACGKPLGTAARIRLTFEGMKLRQPTLVCHAACVRLEPTELRKPEAPIAAGR